MGLRLRSHAALILALAAAFQLFASWSWPACPEPENVLAKVLSNDAAGPKLTRTDVESRIRALSSKPGSGPEIADLLRAYSRQRLGEAQKLSEEELTRAVQAWMDREFNTRGYLPGGPHGPRIRTVSELVRDFVEKLKTGKTSVLQDALGNIHTGTVVSLHFYKSGVPEAEKTSEILDSIDVGAVPEELFRRLASGEWQSFLDSRLLGLLKDPATQARRDLLQSELGRLLQGLYY